jgi:hypothetical protein
MTIRVINGKRYSFDKQRSYCDSVETFCYKVHEVNGNNKQISVSDTLPLKMSYLVEMIKENRLCLERLEGVEK